MQPRVKFEDLGAEALDHSIVQVQRSTRTLVPSFAPVHNALRQRFKWYYWWHLSPWARVIHVAALVYVLLLVLVILLASFLSKPPVSKAVCLGDPPVLSNVRAENVTATTADIKWDTDVLSDSRVDYGTSDSYGSFVSDDTDVTSHSLSVTGLTANTQYHFESSSSNCVGTGYSGDQHFTTSGGGDTTAPVISNLTATSITETGATITWTTNEAASSQVEYGGTASYGNQTSETDTNPRVTSHSVAINGFSCNTTYHYRAKSRDAAGNLGTSSDRTLTTSACSASSSGTGGTGGAGGTGGTGTTGTTSGGTGTTKKSGGSGGTQPAGSGATEPTGEVAQQLPTDQTKQTIAQPPVCNGIIGLFNRLTGVCNVSLPRVVFDPKAPATFDNEFLLTMSSPGRIYYSLVKDDQPTEPYDAPILIADDVTVTAYAVVGNTVGPLETAKYRVKKPADDKAVEIVVDVPADATAVQVLINDQLVATAVSPLAEIAIANPPTGEITAIAQTPAQEVPVSVELAQEPRRLSLPNTLLTPLEATQVVATTAGVVTASAGVVLAASPATASMANTVMSVLTRQLGLFSLLGVRRRRQAGSYLLDRETKLPVAGASAVLLDVKDQRTIATTGSDSQGRFVLAVDRPGTYQLHIRHRHYQPWQSRTFTITQSGQGLPIDRVDLEPTPQAGTVGFGARLFLTTVDVLERVRLPVLIGGTAVVLYGMLVSGDVVSFAPSIGLYVFLWLTEVWLRRRPRPWGRVLDSRTKAPVGQAIVRMFDRKTGRLVHTSVTGSSGRFVFLAPAGTFNLVVIHPRYQLVRNDSVVLADRSSFINQTISLIPRPGARS